MLGATHEGVLAQAPSVILNYDTVKVVGSNVVPDNSPGLFVPDLSGRESVGNLRKSFSMKVLRLSFDYGKKSLRDNFATGSGGSISSEDIHRVSSEGNGEAVFGVINSENSI